MAFTKKQTALALAAVVAIQASAYGVYRWVNSLADKGGSMTGIEEQLAQMEQQRASPHIPVWSEKPAQKIPRQGLGVEGRGSASPSLLLISRHMPPDVQRRAFCLVHLPFAQEWPWLVAQPGSVRAEL